MGFLYCLFFLYCICSYSLSVVEKGKEEEESTGGEGEGGEGAGGVRNAASGTPTGDSHSHSHGCTSTSGEDSGSSSSSKANKIPDTKKPNTKGKDVVSSYNGGNMCIRVQIKAKSNYRLCNLDPQDEDADTWATVEGQFEQCFYIKTSCNGRPAISDRLVTIAVHSNPHLNPKGEGGDGDGDKESSEDDVPAPACASLPPHPHPSHAAPVHGLDLES